MIVLLTRPGRHALWADHRVCLQGCASKPIIWGMSIDALVALEAQKVVNKTSLAISNDTILIGKFLNLVPYHFFQ